MGPRSENAYTAELQTVLRIAHALRDAAGVSHQPSLSPITNSARTVIDSINLPSPRPLLPSLLNAGFSHEIATSISEAYKLRAEELKRRIQESIVTACREIAELPVVALALSPDVLMKKLVFTFTELYLRRLEQWKEEINQRIRQAPKTPTKATPRNTRNFNQEYVPLLEHFFEENPFPTHADKMFLAKKSNMEYRQIHVWFQNRRNRTKKDGKTLRKKPTYEGATKPLDKLYERMKSCIVDSDPQAPNSSRLAPLKGTIDTEVARDHASKDMFASFSPPHAFPSPYPPTCHYDPFPCKSGSVNFSKLERRHVSYGKPLPPLTSIDDLIGRFSHLNVRDETRPRRSPKLQSHAATVAVTVIPPPAPHPSLVASEYIQPANIGQIYPSTRAPLSRLKVFQSPSLSSKPVSLVPLLVPPNRSEFPRKRKTAPLPQRFPSRMQNTHRDAIPSESSSASSSSPRLFSADSESRSCSPPSVSSLSTSSRVTSFPELPHSLGSPCRSPFDSPIHLRGLGDMVAILPSVS